MILIQISINNMKINNNCSLNTIEQVMKFNNYTLNPFHYTNYDFIIPNSIDLKHNFIQFAETCICRAKNQILLSNMLMDIEIALKIELSIFEYALIYCSNNKYEQNYIIPIYQDKLNEILSNLDENKKGIKNKTFKTNILLGKIDPCSVAFLSPAQIHPEKWTYILKKKEYMEQREKNIVYSDAYKCFKCGESKCKITQAQTRSADEPMTTFVVCVVCHNTFKFG